MADVTGTATPKKKEIYKYTAPWSVYAMNWSLRPDKKFRLALGSFIEDYSNKVGRIAYIDTCFGAFDSCCLPLSSTLSI